jgi:hypothetical protein
MKLGRLNPFHRTSRKVSPRNQALHEDFLANEQLRIAIDKTSNHESMEKL